MSEPDAEPAGEDPTAPFTLKLHRGEGMVLLGMNWKGDKPPDDFVGFGIQFREPGGSDFLSVSNRLTFDGTERKPSMQAPIQKFRWVHFPFNAERRGDFTYRVTPVFMDEQDELSFGQAQEANVELARETFQDKLNISFTRGFVSSQAFVDRFLGDGQEISSLLPMSAEPLDFVPSHAQADVALPWMGFEARSALLEVLDQAVADPSAEVHAIAYDLNQPEILDRLEQLGGRLTVIIDDAGPHGESDSPETTAFERLKASAGPAQVRRQHLGGLQHNKCFIVSGPDTNKVVCGSTNFSWRGLYVQNNNAVVLTGPAPVAVFRSAFDDYWASNDAAAFGASSAALWTDLGLTDIDARAVFSPHTPSNAVLGWVAKDIDDAESSLFYSLAFLYMTKGSIRTAIEAATAREDLFVYGISDRTVEGLDLQRPGGNPAAVSPEALTGNVPEPFKSEPIGGGGNRMHHKFVVIDFDKPTARVYLGSYNFSPAADVDNGENLVLIKDPRAAVSYVVEAVRIFDHYEFRVKHAAADALGAAGPPLRLRKPPRSPGEEPWWIDDFTVAHKIRDRLLFS